MMSKGKYHTSKRKRSLLSVSGLIEEQRGFMLLHLLLYDVNVAQMM